MHTSARNIRVMPLLVQFCYLFVFCSAFANGQYQPQYYPGQYFPSFRHSDRRYAQVLYNTFAPTNNHEKRQAPAGLSPIAMPATANMVEQDPVAASQSLSFVVRDPGLQHQDVVNFLTSDKRLSQQPTPPPKSDTYMYEFWQNTQLPVVHWMPLNGNQAPTAPQKNSGKPLPPKAKLENRQSNRPVSPAVAPTISTATLPAALPVNQPSLTHRLQPAKKRKLCRPGFCPGASQQALTPPTPALSVSPPAVASVPEFQLPEQAQKISKAKPSPGVLASQPAMSTPEPEVKEQDSQKPVDLLAQHPFKSNKNVSHSGTRLRPSSRRPDPAKAAAATNNGRLKSNRTPTRVEELITQKSTPLVHPELPSTVHDEVLNTEESLSPQNVDNATKHGLVNPLPRRKLNRPSFFINKKNVTDNTHDEPVSKVTVIPSRVPIRTTTASPKRISIFRSVRPNSTYPARHEAPLLSPQIGKIKALEQKVTNDGFVSEHLTVSKPLNVARKNGNGRTNRFSATMNNAPVEETNVNTVPLKRKVPLFNTAGRNHVIRRKLVRANNDNNSSQPSEQSSSVPEVVSLVTDSTATTSTALPTSTTTSQPSTTAAPLTTTTPPSTTAVPSTVRTTKLTTTQPSSTTTVPSTVPTTSTSTTTAKKLEPVNIKTSVSQVVHVRSETHRAQRVKPAGVQAKRTSGDTVKRHTDPEDRLPKAIDLFELFDSSTATSVTSPLEREPKSIDDKNVALLIVQAPKRRLTPQKDQVLTEGTTESSTTSVSSTTDSTTTTPTTTSETSTVSSAVTAVPTTPAPPTETPTSRHTTSTASPTNPPTSTAAKTTTTISTTEKSASTTVTTSSDRETTLLVTDPILPTTVTARLAEEKVKAPFPFGVVTTEPTKELKLPIISRKSAIASNRHSTTTSSTASSTEETTTTMHSTTPSTVPTTPPATSLSAKASFLEMLRNAVFHKKEDKPVGRSGSYATISIFKPSLLG